MFFYISKLASPFTDPLVIVLLILAASALFLICGRPRWAWYGVGVVIALMTLAMLIPLDFWLVEPLEERFALPAPPACLNGIIVLGGGEDIAGSERRGVSLLAGAPMRYVILSSLMRRYPDAKVIFSGGSGMLGVHNLSEADVSKGIMQSLNLDLNRVVFESRSAAPGKMPWMPKGLRSQNPMNGGLFLLPRRNCHVQWAHSGKLAGRCCPGRQISRTARRFGGRRT